MGEPPYLCYHLPPLESQYSIATLFVDYTRLREIKLRSQQMQYEYAKANTIQENILKKTFLE